MLNNKKNIEIMMTVEMIFKGDDVTREMKREFATAEWSEKRVFCLQESVAIKSDH